MALIIDPDNLTQNTEVTFDTGNKTIELSAAGNLSTDGVTLKCYTHSVKRNGKLILI